MKKYAKKLLLMIAVVVTAVICFAFSAGALTESGQCGENVFWNFEKSTGRLVISGSGDMYDYDTERISPSSSSIRGTSPFSKSYSGIRNIVIEEGVTSVGDYSFFDCRNVSSVKLSDTVTDIGSCAFFWNDISSVTIPHNVKSIGIQAFSYCWSLKTVTLSEGLESICRSAFYVCRKLSEITIPDSVTKIEENIFESTAYYNDSSNWVNGGLYCGNHLIKVRTTTSGTFKIRDGTKTIAEEAFLDCKNIKEVIIPQSVVTIGDYAFKNCTGLESVVIPYGTINVGAYAFYGCAGLETVTLSDTVRYIGSSAFSGCPDIRKVYINDVESWLKLDFAGFVSNPTYFGADIYVGNQLLTKLVIPEGITEVGETAFYNCTSITEVTFPKSVEKIGRYAFYGCVNLEKALLSDNVTEIGLNAFLGCSKLKTVSLGKKLEKIEYQVFYDCLALENVVIPDTVTAIEKSAFGNCKSLTEIKIPDKVTIINDNAFRNCVNLRKAVIGKSVTEIGRNAFYYCVNLTDVIIPANVAIIGQDAFYNCKKLTGITVLNENLSIDSAAIPETAILYCYENSAAHEYAVANSRAYVLLDASDKKSIVNGTAGTFKWKLDKRTGVLRLEGKGKLADYASEKAPWYGYRDYITSLQLPEGFTAIGTSAFEDLYRLEGVTIPDGVTSIGDNAFKGCSGLFSVTIPADVTYIGARAFRSCTGLTDITVSAGVKNIGESAFKGCIKLKEIIIPYSVKSIDSTAFDTTVEKVTIYSRECYITEDCGIAKTDTVYGFRNSTAEKVAAKIGAKFVDIGSSHSHTYKTTTIKATLKKNGRTENICTLCGDIKSTATVYYPKTVKLSYTETTYNGKVKAPKVVVKDSKGNTLKKDTYYTVKYSSGRKKPGKYTVTVTFKGKYSGTKKLTLAIKPKAPKVTDIYSKTKGKAVIKWNNVTGESGYRVYYSTSKNGTYKKVKSYAADKTAGSKTKLKSGKKYYFKVRAYKKTSSGTVYSSWSSVKSVKIK